MQQKQSGPISYELGSDLNKGLLEKGRTSRPCGEDVQSAPQDQRKPHGFTEGFI